MLEGSHVIAIPIVYNYLTGQTIRVANGAAQVATRLNSISTVASVLAVTTPVQFAEEVNLKKVSLKTLSLAEVYLREVCQLVGGVVVSLENGDYFWLNKPTGLKKCIPNIIESFAKRELKRRDEDQKHLY